MELRDKFDPASANRVPVPPVTLRAQRRDGGEDPPPSDHGNDKDDDDRKSKKDKKEKRKDKKSDKSLKRGPRLTHLMTTMTMMITQMAQGAAEAAKEDEGSGDAPESVIVLQICFLQVCHQCQTCTWTRAPFFCMAS